MMPRFVALDLDGTLLQSNKKLSTNNIHALREMAGSGALVALASGRLGSSMTQYAPELNIDLGMVTLNGAAVYSGADRSSRLLYEAPLPAEFAEILIDHAAGRNFAINYYTNERLYSVRTERSAPWHDLYYNQTRTECTYLENFAAFQGLSPAKIIFVGDPAVMNEEEDYFRNRWGDALYICRTWDYYLEFLSSRADKGIGIRSLAGAYDIDLADVVAFGDANNDIPMLQAAGLGIAMANAAEEVKQAAQRVSPWTNDQDGVAREWNLLKESRR